MKKVAVFIVFSLLIISISKAQKVIGFGAQFRSYTTDGKLVKTNNSNVVTHEIADPGLELFCRLNLSECMGIKIGITPISHNYISTVSTEKGQKSISWGILSPQLPIGFYYKRPSVVGKLYFFMESDIMFIPSESTSASQTNDELNVYFETKQTNDWGTNFTFQPGFGYTFSRRIRIELGLYMAYQIFGDIQVQNKYKYVNSLGNEVTETDEIKDNKHFDFSNRYTFSLIYMFTKKEKPNSVKPRL